MNATATPWALNLLANLHRSGVRGVVVSPGSRSQALALAAYALSEHPESELDLHVSIDERSAGFLALGLSIHSGAPTVLVCTSGSAPAHYLPALLEAKHSGVPLIVISADRPERLQGVGANQTSDQVGMFGPAVVACIQADLAEVAEPTAHARAVAAQVYQQARSGALGGRSGPAHLNVRIDEPLSSPVDRADCDEAFSHAIQEASPASSSEPREIRLEPQEGTLIVAGHLAGSEAEALAVSLGAPLIAEVHSGAHHGPHLVVAYRDLLQNPPTPITRVITVGRPTLSREVQALLSRRDIEQIVWQRGEPEPANPSRNALVVDQVEPGSLTTTSQRDAWVTPWLAASRAREEAEATELDPAGPNVALASGDMKQRATFAKEEMEVYRRALTRRDIAQLVWQVTWPHDQLILGSSRMIREFDRVAPGKKIPVWASRGLSGIDGTVATSRGIALSRARDGATGVTRVVMGDLAFAHDAGSLLLDRGEAGDTWVQLVVVRDGGGSIFDLLEAKGDHEPKAFDRVMFTPVALDTKSLAKAYGWDYQGVATLGELSEALMNHARHLIIECVIER